MSISSTKNHTKKLNATEIYAKKQKEIQKITEDKLLFVLQEAYGTNNAYKLYNAILSREYSLSKLEEYIEEIMEFDNEEEEDSWYNEEDDWE